MLGLEGLKGSESTVLFHKIDDKAKLRWKCSQRRHNENKGCQSSESFEPFATFMFNQYVFLPN